MPATGGQTCRNEYTTRSHIAAEVGALRLSPAHLLCDADTASLSPTGCWAAPRVSQLQHLAMSRIFLAAHVSPHTQQQNLNYPMKLGGWFPCPSRTSFAIADTPRSSQVTDQCSGHGVPSGVPDNGWDGSVMEWVPGGQSIYPGNRTSTVPLAQHCANAVEPSQKPGHVQTPFSRLHTIVPLPG